MTKVKDVVLPGQEETFAQRRAKLKADHPRMVNPASNSPFDAPNRTPKNVASRAALKKLTKQLKKRVDQNWESKHNKAGRRNAMKMMDTVGLGDLKKKVKGLSPAEFSDLWNVSPFATNLSINYENLLKMMSDKDKPYISDQNKTETKEAEKWIEWAKRNRKSGS